MTTTSARPPMARAGDGTRADIAAKTLRTDRWWFPPAITVVGLTAWLAYGLVRVYLHRWYYVADYQYLTPFYSPCTSTACIPEAAHFGRFTPDWKILPWAPLSLPFLLVFRNAHRYAFYAAFIISVINSYDAIVAFHGKGGGFGFGLGNLVLLTNVVLLWAYTLSCHSCRHIVGGRLKNFSKHPLRYRAWTFVSKLNVRHMQLAWITLGTLALTDAYVMAVSAGWIADLRFYH